MNYKPYLKWTHISAAVIFVGLLAWNLYFADEFDPFREPYSGADFQDRQVDSVEVDPSNTEESEDGTQEASVNVYGVSAIHPLAADVGMQIMEEGGNAVDAAVAVSFMLNVVEPYGSGIGGGGVMLLHDPEDGIMSYDYRESAPESGMWPANGAAVPGLVKGMETIYNDYGTLAWEDLMTDAIETAEEGFQVGEVFNRTTGSAVRRLDLSPENQERFYPEGQTLEINETLVQPDLANTLRIIQEEGASGFYEGEIAASIAEETDFTEEDFMSYNADVRDPVSAEIGDQIVHGGPSPSSGAVAVQALQMADRLEQGGYLQELIGGEGTLEELVNDPDHQDTYMHLINEMTSSAYSYRLDTLADPAFHDIDHERLTQDEAIDVMFERISSAEITDADEELFDSPAEETDSRNTTHFVIVDQEGRMVSATHSLGEFYGSGVHVDGIFLNNQMNNFSGDDASALNGYAPGKRPRTFVSPMIFEEQGKPVLGVGSPGGRRIPAMVYQTVMRYQYGLNDNGEPLTLQEAIRHPRFYNENDVTYVEDSDFPEETAQSLRDMGYSVVGNDSELFYGGIQGLGITLDENGNTTGMYGGGDPRRNGAWQIETEE
ncbi:gamma-glutamyltransferase family protein [Alkalicoccus halolimnae]|uniref:Gamma-glutamyltransferase n=1 Tax=Alkalicoccus halolimnae TaxID=1667239 RepID=A0A5C7F377_9BACI|nr:gamma-glutamyltransferase [Alkalicoccus halolimnae]TXF82325.1 gamma-glutamyltransferase [Alkalicoccus halolimnae]